MQLIVKLTDGWEVRSKDAAMSPEEQQEAQDLISNVLESDPSDGSCLSFTVEDGWVCIPGRSIFYARLSNELEPG